MPNLYRSFLFLQRFITLMPEQTEPPNGSCLINKWDSMVMLLDPSVPGKHELECDISSKDGIMISSWSGFIENNDKDNLPDNFPPGQLSKFAKEQVNLGAVTSDVKVDGKSVAKLDEISSVSNNILNYKINPMDNFTEFYAKPFNITIPYIYIPLKIIMQIPRLHNRAEVNQSYCYPPNYQLGTTC